MKTKEMEVEIKSLNPKGLGKAQGLDIRGALPGEIVRISKRGRNVRLQEIIQPHEKRCLPRCSHVPVCGGCTLQQWDYPGQLANKQRLIEGLFDHPVRPIIPSPKLFRYRNKMEFTFSGNHLGLMMPGGRGRVLSLKECHLCNPWMVRSLEGVRRWWAMTGLEAYYAPKNVGSLRFLCLREGLRTGDRLAMLTASADTPPTEAQLELLAQIYPNLLLRLEKQQKGEQTRFFDHLISGKSHLFEEISGLRFKVSATAFFQPNTEAAEKLYDVALKLAGIKPSDVVYDLYCGTGTMGILAARHAREVHGIELNHQAAQDGRENAALNGISNITIHAGDVGEVLKGLPQADLLLVDPPRVGLSKEARSQLLRLKTSKIVYVSCNPRSQAQDIQYLTQHGYKITAIQPVDQFPHTAHVENVVCLEFHPKKG